MGLFILSFFLVYGGAHLIFFLKAVSVVSLGPFSAALLAFFLLVMAIAPLLVRALERGGMEESARGLAYAGYLWMGFLFLFISATLAMDLCLGILHAFRVIFHRDLSPLVPSNRALFALPFAWGIVTEVYGYFEARNIKTERVVITSRKIPRGVGKLTIVQISDVHLGLIVRRKRLEWILRRVRAAAPDILVSTGDLVDGQLDRKSPVNELLRDLKPRFGKFAVTGNHEAYAGLGQALSFIEGGGFRVLQGESFAAGVINIIGVDDPVAGGDTHSRSEQEVLSELSPGPFTLLLKHRPVVEKESIGLFDLQLSGHVHKGQIFPFNLVTHLLYPVKSGYSTYPRGSALYVSRGAGTWGPPVRFLAPPEITVIELLPAVDNP